MENIIEMYFMYKFILDIGFSAFVLLFLFVCVIWNFYDEFKHKKYRR